MSEKYLAQLPVAVGPTSTSMGIIDSRDTRWVAIQAKNLDATQTLTCTVRRRARLADDFAPSVAFDEFFAIPALASRVVDFDSGLSAEVEVLGVASGGGLNSLLTMKPDHGRRP